MRPYVLHWLERYMTADTASLLAPSWFTCVGLAGLVTLILMLVLARRRGVDAGTVASAVLWCYVAAVVAGIMVPMVLDAVGHLVTTGRVHLRWSGMTSFWGYLAGATAVALVCRRDGLSLGRMADLSIIPLGVALGFARLGCFMAGCDYGKVSSVPWAIRFPAGSPAWRDHLHAGLIPAGRAASLPVHPTQLYEALLGLAIAGIAIYARRWKRSAGDGFLLGAVVYAVGRLVIETLRGDAGRGIYAGLSSGQIFSLLVLLVIGARFLAPRRRPAFAAVATALVVATLGLGEANAQSAPESAPPSQPSQPSDPPPEPPPPAVAQAPDPTERPLFSAGVLFGIATPLTRRADQVPTLTGASLSIGWLPGRFGAWLDVDSFASSEASHSTVLAAVSYTYRPTRSLMFGVRSGVGLTMVDFNDRAFRDVTGETVRLEAMVEYAPVRHWVLWVRPLTVDLLSAADLGGAIVSSQVRIGVAYRFGSRRNARPAPPSPSLPPPLPPQLPPDSFIEPARGAP